MASTNLNIRIDSEIKEAAETIFEALGMNMTTAVNIFLRQTIRENGIPFELKLDTRRQTQMNAINALIECKKTTNGKEMTGYRKMSAYRTGFEV